MTEVTETKEVAQVLRGPDGEVLAAGGEEVERYHFQQKVKALAEEAATGRRRTIGERSAAAEAPPAGRTAQEEEASPEEYAKGANVND
jgi:hypothetical protein